jgi:hypothetical protein
MVRIECNTDMSSADVRAVENARFWIGEALARGLIVTAERRPRAPLAMGNADTVVMVRREIDHVGEAAVRGSYQK